MGLACVSLAGFMVTFGGIHFNFFSLGKQDSTMGISARKKKPWHVREQMRHIFIFNPTNTKTEPRDYNNSWDSRGGLAVDCFDRIDQSHKISS
jgi:hypothetical protein